MFHESAEWYVLIRDPLMLSSITEPICPALLEEIDRVSPYLGDR